MDRFSALLEAYLPALERFIKFRIPTIADAEDIVQETAMTAFEKFGQLRSEDAFRSWLIGIARKKCADYFRSRGQASQIPAQQGIGCMARADDTLRACVRETLLRLSERDREMLLRYYFHEQPQTQIAAALQIPLGTVKSRLHTARSRFAQAYPYPPNQTKGRYSNMKFPNIMPQYTIEKMDAEPFSVVCVELPGWLIAPRLGEKLSWALYDFPERKLTEFTDMEVLGRAQVHGIEGVEIAAVQYGAQDYYRTGCIDRAERRFVAQLTPTHCRFLAESHVEDGVRKCYTFLDGEEFMNNWGFGADNCGKEVCLAPKGCLKWEGDSVAGACVPENLDIVGRYRVCIGGKAYDTVCVMDIMTFNDAIVTEEYLDRNGRCILWRRFNRDDWALERFGGKPWSEKLPDNEQLTVNGETFVHWYDCVTSDIF